MPQFHQFPDLPTELRDIIWDAAIRDNRPAAHFFSLYDRELDKPFVIRPETRIHPAHSSQAEPWCIGLAAPEGAEKNNGHSWARDSESVYMTDSGLWTACWESRWRMLWHFRSTAPRSPAASAGAEVTMPFLRDNGEQQYLTIRPSQDLLCLGDSKGGLSSLRMGSMWTRIQEFPFFSGGAPRHVAAKFDPSWSKIRGPTYCEYECFTSAQSITGIEGFWFIDYALARRYKADDVDGHGRRRRPRQTFQAAGGMEFVEVRSGDNEWWDRSTKSNEVYRSGQGESSAQWWASIIQDEIDWLYASDDEDDVDESSKESSHESHGLVQFGVLACVQRGSEKHLPTKSEWMDRQWGVVLYEGNDLLGDWSSH